MKYENAFPLRNLVLLLEIKVEYVEDIIVTRDTAKLGTSRKEVIQVIPFVLIVNVNF